MHFLRHSAGVIGSSEESPLGQEVEEPLEGCEAGPESLQRASHSFLQTRKSAVRRSTFFAGAKPSGSFA